MTMHNYLSPPQPWPPEKKPPIWPWVLTTVVVLGFVGWIILV